MWTSEQTAYNVMKTAAVLTASAQFLHPMPLDPPTSAVRNVFTGWRICNGIGSSIFHCPANVPAWSQYERYFQRPWLDHLNGGGPGQWLLPIDNQPAYGREFARIVLSPH